MTYFKKHKATNKKAAATKNTMAAETSNKSPYSKQNIKKKLNEFGDNDAL
ncbi:hypothetical protein L1S35_08025 [Flavobacterium sp. AS60]|nr:hypothetical protein [Flavobacterium sp. AS60]MCF6129616.1 hypothetical protein [Flavobacterium sp. AS60]